MKAGWQALPLEELCDLTSGLWKGKKGPFKTVGVIRNTNFNVDGSLDDLDIAFIDVEERQLAKKTLQYGDVILEKSGGGPKQPVGRVALYNVFEREFSYSNFTAAIRVKRPAILSFRYLHLYLYWLHLNGTTEKIQSHSTGIRNLNLSAYKKLPIPFPTKHEQERIVAVLDQAFGEIASASAMTEQNRSHAHQCFSSLLAETFTPANGAWSYKPVSMISEHSLGKMLDKTKNRGLPQPYLRNLNVRWFEFDLSDLNEMLFKPEELSRYTITKGDVVICEGGYPGRAAVWEADEPIHFQKALHRVRFYNPIHAKWFVFYLYSQHLVGSLRQWFTGTGILHFTGEALALFQIPVAPEAEISPLLRKCEEVQQAVIAVDKLYQDKVAALSALKQSLLHQAFSGNL